MADGVPITPGVGATVATDDAGASGQVQIVKLALSADGSAVPIAADANGLDVDIVRAPGTAADAGALPAVLYIVGGYDGSNTQALATDASGVLQVDVANEPAVTVSGVSTAAKQDTTITRLTEIEEAVDGVETLLGTSNTNTGAAVTALQLLDNAVSGNELQVDVVAALPAGTNNIGDVDVLTLPALASGTNAIGKLAANSGVDIGDVDVTSISAGTNKIGDVGVGTRTSGGLSIFRSLDLDETEEEVKNTTGQIYGYYISNKATSARFVKIYNATAANVTVGSTTPLITLEIPKEGAANLMGDIGVAFGTAITVAATTGVADADTGAPAANDVVVNLFYA